MWSAWYASPGDMISWCGDMMIWLWYIWYESQSVFSAWSASPETVRLQCGICHPVPRRNPHCEHLWTCVDSTLIMRANLGTERPLEKYWPPHFLDPSCRTTPRMGCWHCNKGQRSDVQGTSAARPLLWCSGTPLNNKIKNPSTLLESLMPGVTCQIWRVHRDLWQWPSLQEQELRRESKIVAPLSNIFRHYQISCDLRHVYTDTSGHY